jgi:hypothetical protein
MKNINLIIMGLITSVSGVLISTPSQALPENSLIAQAQPPLNVNQVVDQAFYQHSRDIFGISTIGGQLNDLLGWEALEVLGEGSYPENQIRRDGKLLNTIHQDLWKQQTQSTEAIRSQDLPNPYCASIQTGINKTCQSN